MRDLHSVFLKGVIFFFLYSLTCLYEATGASMLMANQHSEEEASQAKENRKFPPPRASFDVSNF